MFARSDCESFVCHVYPFLLTLFFFAFFLRGGGVFRNALRASSSGIVILMGACFVIFISSPHSWVCHVPNYLGIFRPCNLLISRDGGRGEGGYPSYHFCTGDVACSPVESK